MLKHLNINIVSNMYILYEENKIFPFFETIKIQFADNMFYICICRPDGHFFLQEIWSTYSYFYPNMGPEAQALHCTLFSARQKRGKRNVLCFITQIYQDN